MRWLRTSWLALAVGCAGGGTGDSTFDATLSCGDESYPTGAVEPMAMGEVLAPYGWPDAEHRGTGVRTALDLAYVPCAGDPVIDWSPFDVLLFVSIPAW